MTKISHRCRVRIVNDITDRTTIIESPRDRFTVVLDLIRLVRSVNRRRAELLRASLHLTDDLIVLHWHCPCAGELAKDIIDLAEPLQRVEKLIWQGGKKWD